MLDKFVDRNTPKPEPSDEEIAKQRAGRFGAIGAVIGGALVAKDVLTASPAQAQGVPSSDIDAFRTGLRDAFDPINFPPLENDMTAQQTNWSGIDLDQRGLIRAGINAMPDGLKPHVERVFKALSNLVAARDKIKLLSMQELLAYRKEPERIKLYFRGGYENSPVSELIKLATEVRASADVLMEEFLKHHDFRNPRTDYGKNRQLLLRIQQACDQITVPEQKQVEEAVDTLARDYDRMQDRSRWDTNKPTKEDYHKVRVAIITLDRLMTATTKLPQAIKTALENVGVFRPGNI